MSSSGILVTGSGKDAGVPHQEVDANPDERQDSPYQELKSGANAITSGVKPQMFADSMWMSGQQRGQRSTNGLLDQLSELPTLLHCDVMSYSGGAP